MLNKAEQSWKMVRKVGGMLLLADMLLRKCQFVNFTIVIVFFIFVNQAQGSRFFCHPDLWADENVRKNIPGYIYMNCTFILLYNVNFFLEWLWVYSIVYYIHVSCDFLPVRKYLGLSSVCVTV